VRPSAEQGSPSCQYGSKREALHGTAGHGGAAQPLEPSLTTHEEVWLTTSASRLIAQTKNTQDLHRLKLPVGYLAGDERPPASTPGEQTTALQVRHPR